MDKRSGAQGDVERVQSFYRTRAAHAPGHVVSRMVPDRSKNWSRPAEIQSWYAGAAGPFSYCDARSPIPQSTDCGPESFTGHVHWQCPQLRSDDISDHAVVRQGAEVVDLARAGCAEKRALERGAPCRCALRGIGCNFLEIY